jgi:cytochrome c553
MRYRYQSFIACLLGVLTLASPHASAANVAHGQQLYQSICIACHGFPPAGGPERAANNPALISTAIQGRVAAMAFLRNTLSSTDLDDIAAYLGTLAAPAPPPPPSNISYQGLWLKTPFEAESGWGINLTHQGNTLFATWFTYDVDGTGMWLVMSDGARTSEGKYSGALHRTTGPGFSATPFSSIGPQNYTLVGTLSFSFTDAKTGTMTYTVNGVTQSKPIALLIYALPAPDCTLGGAPGAAPNYQDLWWRSPAGSESGWGVNITHQGDILFATWFTYEAGGSTAAPAKGMWLVMSAGLKTAPGVYTGELQRTTGPAFSAVPFNPSLVTRTTVGSATFAFTDANSGTFSYTVNGVSQSKPITRLNFSSPTTVCR